MMKLYYVTGNEHKLELARKALKDSAVELLPADADIDEIQADSQETVALDKAKKAYATIKCPLVVMDSGLFIEPLKGFPGVYTKYALDTLGVKGLLNLCKQFDNSQCLAYTMRTIVYTDGHIFKVFSSTCKGKIIQLGRGENGYDYDQFFLVSEMSKTIAEMDDNEKAMITGRAWRDLAKWLVRRADGKEAA